MKVMFNPKKVINLFFLCAKFFVIVIAIASCSKNNENERVVISVNDKVVNYSDFIRSFNLYPEYNSNSTLKDVLIQHAGKLADDLYYLKAAELESFDTLQDIQRKLKYILHSEMLKELYNTNVLNKIDVTDEEAWNEYKKENISVSARHLFARNLDEINFLYNELRKGKDFISLAHDYFKDSLLTENGGYLGYVRITDFDPLLIDSIYNLKVGKYSHPLESSYGYHIFRIDDVKQSVFLDKTYFENNKEEFKNKIRNRRALRQSSQFVKETLHGKSVNIQRSIFNKVNHALLKHIEIRNSQTLMLYPNISNNEIVNVANDAKQIADSILVKFNDGSLTVKDFIKKITNMPPMHRPMILGENNLVKVIIDMIRDKFLLEAALDGNLDKSEIVKKNVSSAYNQLLSDEFEKSILLASRKEESPTKWEERRELLSSIKSEFPAKIDTSLLFKNFSTENLNQKLPAIKMVIRNQYKW